MDATKHLKSILESKSGERKEPAVEESDDTTPFAVGRIGNKPQLCVTFEKGDGSCITLSYTHLYAIESECPGMGCKLVFSEHNVIVSGNNLTDLYRFLGDHKIRLIRETPDQTFLQSTLPMVLKIEIES